MHEMSKPFFQKNLKNIFSVCHLMKILHRLLGRKHIVKHLEYIAALVSFTVTCTMMYIYVEFLPFRFGNCSKILSSL